MRLTNGVEALPFRAVAFYSDKSVGVIGTTTAGFGVIGHSTANHGVVGESQGGEGVHGVSDNRDHGGVVGVCDSPKGGTGVYGKCDSGKAGWFDDNVLFSEILSVKGDVVLLGADLAKQVGVLDGAGARRAREYVGRLGGPVASFADPVGWALRRQTPGAPQRDSHRRPDMNTLRERVAFTGVTSNAIPWRAAPA